MAESRGRKPVPSQIKELRGTARQDRVLKNEAQFPIPGRMVSPPKDLGEDGAELWKSLGKLLLEAGLFSLGDKIALEMLCMAYDRMKVANRMIELESMVLTTENGYHYQNPYLSIANTAWGQVKSMLAEFGLTPAERTRVLAAVLDDGGAGGLADQLFNAVQRANSENAKK